MDWTIIYEKYLKVRGAFLLALTLVGMVISFFVGTTVPTSSELGSNQFGLEVVEECRELHDTFLSGTPTGYVCLFDNEVQITPTATIGVTVTSTVVPIVTSTPNVIIQPYEDADKCDESVHDSTLYHGLWNYQIGCHYDHTHNDNPNDVNGTFGDLPFDEISYLHQTPNENELKHTGYLWDVRNDGTPLLGRNVGQDSSIIRHRCQFHWVGGYMGINQDVHSYYCEMQIEKDGVIGIAKIGGVMHVGCIVAPYKGYDEDGNPLKCFSQDGDDFDYSNQNSHAPPYRGHGFNSNNGIVFGNAHWNSENTYGYNISLELDTFTGDDWQGVNVEDSSIPMPLLGENYNRSTMVLYELKLDSNLYSDYAVNGILNYSGFVDEFGNIDETCQGHSFNCIPVVFENLPIGVAALREAAPFASKLRDYDIYFHNITGELCVQEELGASIPQNCHSSGWIEHPNPEFIP